MAKKIDTKTIDLANKRNEDLTVTLKKLTDDEQKHYGVDVNGQMSFKFGWSDDDNFLDVKNKRYIKTTRDGITAMLGNGMSGTASLFFDYNDLDKVIEKLTKIGWTPKII